MSLPSSLSGPEAAVQSEGGRIRTGEGLQSTKLNLERGLRTRRTHTLIHTTCLISRRFRFLRPILMLSFHGFHKGGRTHMNASMYGSRRQVDMSDYPAGHHAQTLGFGNYGCEVRALGHRG